MVTIHTAEARKMRRLIYKYGGIFVSAIVFLFLPLCFAGAVNYGSGLYNSGFYSSTAPSSPEATPGAGTYNSTQSVSLTASGSTSVRYSFVSTPADCTSGTLYTTPISVSSSATIYARSCNSYGNSSVASFAYIIDTVPPSTPTSSYLSGSYNTTLSVVLNSTGSDYIKYSTVSLPASCSLGTSYSGPITVSSSSTIYVLACDNAGNSSSTSFNYVIDTTEPLTPVASPSAGTYNSSKSVTVTASDSDYIKYSITSLPASCSAGTLYSGAIAVSSSTTIYIRACDDAGNSSTASFSYIIDTVPPSSPTASPDAGSYGSAQSVSLSSSGSDYIKYSTTSLPASCSTGTSYSGPITISSSSTIYVRACDDAGNSSTNSFTYVINTTTPSTPVATPGEGTYSTAQLVSLSSTYSNYIRYSTSVIPSTCSSGTLYTTPIQVLRSMALYVKACDNEGNYAETKFEYIISKNSTTGTTALFRNNFVEQQKVLSNPNPDPSLGLKKFTRSLSQNTTGEDVKALQVYLNTHGYVIVKSGPGSPGKETNYFGLKTKQALMRFQKANKLKPVGTVGPLTRALLNK